MSDMKNSVVAVYESHDQAEAAINELKRSSFDVTKLSIMGKDYQTEEHVVGYYNIGDRMKAWGKFGAFWGGIWGLLTGAALFAIPGIGHVIIGGYLVSVIVSVLEGAVVVGGLSAIGAALYSLGIPKNSILDYETDLKAGKFVVIAHGTKDEIEKAQQILTTTTDIKQMSVYPKSDTTESKVVGIC